MSYNEAYYGLLAMASTDKSASKFLKQVAGMLKEKNELLEEINDQRENLLVGNISSDEFGEVITRIMCKC